MAGDSTLVNLTGFSATWILELILQHSEVKEDVNSYTFNIKTKYFNADVNLNHVDYAQVVGSSDVDHFEKTEALLLYCEGTKASFAKAEKVWEKAKSSAPSVCLCIVDTTKENIKTFNFLQIL